MDYVDFIVHVFSPEKRAFYGLERLRKSATTISVADLNAELKSAIATTRAKLPGKRPRPSLPRRPQRKQPPRRRPRLAKSTRRAKKVAAKPAAKAKKPKH